jgi:beta-glucosidase-like glycosyl hydrolase
VLLKNGKSASAPLLPLPKKAGKILVAGSHADNLGNQCGGWTITWQGLDGNGNTAGKWRLLFHCLYKFVATSPSFGTKIHGTM